MFLCVFISEHYVVTSIAFSIVQFLLLNCLIGRNLLCVNRKKKWTLPIFLGVSTIIELTMIAGCQTQVYSFTSITVATSTMPCGIVPYHSSSRSLVPARLYSIYISIACMNNFLSPQIKHAYWPGFLGIFSNIQIFGTTLLLLVNIWISKIFLNANKNYLMLQQ
ncbi:hypothetical protein TRFO_27892 [Tritrichomonas foetus]|uniref:Uncharacterized protein n=1 Tax=Tritrichomonas foetus TaxID=1144522 RepID=A0A1J4K4Z5_9EUKA|nr:hypothetical protein TRFO_27892 [Tritrichomonas foetus]|eukprot:OHT04573.1 hypothetical protein TRFO_27892 [Tritrichomonas foetus]